MNSCEYYQELISRLMDGEVSHDEHEALMEHMNTCSRCNAMYAVFHDLSDILSEEPEALPAGLHETIMADVRRSELRRKNRRMRTIGLRTALTAAACLVLVLFAASGFVPGRGAEDVVLSNEEAAAIPALTALPQVTAPTALPQVTAPSAPPVTAAPAQDAAALPQESFTAQQNNAPAAPDAYLASGDSKDAQYNTPQPIQYFQYQSTTPAPVYTSAPVYTPAPVYTQAPVYVPETVYTPADTEPETWTVPELNASAKRAAAPAQETPAEEWELSSLSLEDLDVFEAAAPDELSVSEGQEEAEEPLGFDAAAPEEPTAPDEGIAEAEPEPTPGKKDTAPRLSVRGKEMRAKLLALLAGSEEALPEEAELTRTVRLALVPEDAYGSEEKLDIRVYGDFVFYELSGAEGAKTFRAACSLAELDSFLKTLEAAPTPVPSPTQDPYGTP